MMIRYIEFRNVIEHLPLLAEKKEQKEDRLSSCNVDAQWATENIVIVASSSLF